MGLHFRIFEIFSFDGKALLLGVGWGEWAVDACLYGVRMADGALAAPGKGMSVGTGRRGSQMRVTVGCRWSLLAG